MPNTLNVLEEQIDIDLQMEYFEHSRKIKRDLDGEKVMIDSHLLFSDRTGATQKKDLLAKLASLEEISAFRTIERFISGSDGELRDWSILALKESRMLLEAKLLDENQVFISTGLGGKGNNLRYFVVLLCKDNKNLDELQQKIVRNEFQVTLKKYNGETEAFNFSGSLGTVRAVVPISVPVKAIFEEAVSECNLYGNFLESRFIITNVKELSFQEIRDLLEGKN
jgi:hypothetical protein